MSEVVSFNEARAVAANDARLWSPADALRAVLRDIESGRYAPDMVYIAMHVRGDGAPDSYPFSCAGSANLGMIGLLTKHLHITAGD